MNNLHFIIPGQSRIETGVVQEEVRFGYMLCWFGGQPSTGRLIHIEDMKDWLFYTGQPEMLAGLARLQGKIPGRISPDPSQEPLKQMDLPKELDEQREAEEEK